jgi:hypothetical protein
MKTLVRGGVRGGGLLAAQTARALAQPSDARPAAAHAALVAGFASCSSQQGPKGFRTRSTATGSSDAAATTATTSGVSFLHHATGLSGHQELHARLAAVWGMPAELLFERQQALARILGPSGLDSSAHALWVSFRRSLRCNCNAASLPHSDKHRPPAQNTTTTTKTNKQVLVRAPQLRHASEHSLRGNLRQLHRLVAQQPDVDRAAVLTAVYKHPWMVSAMAASPPPTAAGAAHDNGSSDCGPRGCSTWKQELAAVILERQVSIAAEAAAEAAAGQPQARRGTTTTTSSWTLSQAFAAAAVRAFVAVAEVAQAVSRALPFAPRAAAAPAATQHDQQPQPGNTTAPASSASTSTGLQWEQQQQQQQTRAMSTSANSFGSLDVLAQLQAQHEQHRLLQQILAACPHLSVLPPDVLLARWQRLEWVLQGGGDAAGRLLRTNTWMLLNVDDVEAWRHEAHALRHTYV